MENGIPVTNVEKNPDQTLHNERPHVPEQVREISEQLSGAFKDFTKSQRYRQLQTSAEKAKDYIRNNPLPATLYALGAGMFLGFLLKRKH
jgi:ElaB/YqjD/DUF883 family membrane-anchored ribosome-binding protein